MGLFDKIKSAFIEEDEEDIKAAQQAAQQQQQAAPQDAPAQQYNAPGTQEIGMPTVDMSQPSGEGKINPDLLRTFEAALRDFNLPGPDYLELKSIIDNENFRKNIPDENQRIVSAFFSIQAGNPTFSKAIVLNSLQQYVEKMEGERTSALQQLGQRIEEEITAPTELIEQKFKRIEELQAQMVQVQGEIKELQAEVAQKRAELNTKKLDFDVTINALIGALKADMVKIDNAIN